MISFIIGILILNVSAKYNVVSVFSSLQCSAGTKISESSIPGKTLTCNPSQCSTTGSLSLSTTCMDNIYVGNDFSPAGFMKTEVFSNSDCTGTITQATALALNQCIVTGSVAQAESARITCSGGIITAMKYASLDCSGLGVQTASSSNTCTGGVKVTCSNAFSSTPNFQIIIALVALTILLKI
jgi:hypothetical protein